MKNNNPSIQPKKWTQNATRKDLPNGGKKNTKKISSTSKKWGYNN